MTVNGGADVALAEINALAGGADIDAGNDLTLNGEVDAQTGAVGRSTQGGLITQGAAVGGDNDTATVAITSTGGSLDSNNTIDAVASVAITTGQNVDLLSVVTAGTSIAIDAGGTVDAASLLSAGTSVDVSGDDNVNLVEGRCRWWRRYHRGFEREPDWSSRRQRR